MPRVSDLMGLGWGPRTWISSKCPGDVVLMLACRGTTLKNHLGLWRELETSQVPDLSDAFHMLPLAPCVLSGLLPGRELGLKTPGCVLVMEARS